MDLPFKTSSLVLDSLEDRSNTVRNKCWRGAVIALLCRPDLTVGTAVTEQGNLNAMGQSDPGVAGAKCSTEDKVGVVSVIDSRVKESVTRI